MPTCELCGETIADVNVTTCPPCRHAYSEGYNAGAKDGRENQKQVIREAIGLRRQ
jgi:hypothetical protein